MYLEARQSSSGWDLVAVLRCWDTQRRLVDNFVQEVQDELRIADSYAEEGGTLTTQAELRSLFVP